MAHAARELGELVFVPLNEPAHLVLVGPIGFGNALGRTKRHDVMPLLEEAVERLVGRVYELRRDYSKIEFYVYRRCWEWVGRYVDKRRVIFQKSRDARRRVAYEGLPPGDPDDGEWVVVAVNNE